MTDTITVDGIEYKITDIDEKGLTAERSLVGKARRVARDVFGSRLKDVASTDGVGGSEHKVVIQVETPSRAGRDQPFAALDEINGGVTHVDVPDRIDMAEDTYSLNVDETDLLIFC